MERKKPVGVLVIGIINLILGGLSLAAYAAVTCCLGAVVLLFSYAMQNMPQRDREQFEQFWPIFVDNIPGLIPFMIIAVLLSLVLAVLHVITGWGCVRIKPWGRWTTVIWGVANLLVLCASLAYSLAVVYPGTQKALPELDRWLDKIEEDQKRKGQAVQPRTKISTNSGTGNVIIDNVSSILLSMVQMGYAAFVVIFMLLPTTGRAIERYNHPEGDANARELGDFDGDDYDRQRRSLGEPPAEPPP